MLPALAGDCIEIFFEDPFPRMVVIDGGMGKVCRTILKRDVYDWKARIGPVDLAILTHMDNDHINGFLSLVADKDFDKNTLAAMWFNYGKEIEKNVEKSTEKRLFVSDDSCLTSGKQGSELYQIINSKGIPLFAPITSGISKIFGKYCVEVISPSTECLNKYVASKEYQSYQNLISDTYTAAQKKDYKYSIEELLKKKFDDQSVTNANASSIVVMIAGEQQRILCLGDSKPSEVEMELRNRGYSEDNPLAVDFLKVSHHGSAHSTSDSLIRVLDCCNYLISANWKTLPTKECLARIIVNSKKPVTFWCNYEPDITIFSEKEYEQYGMKFKNVKNMEIEVSGKRM